MLKATKCRLYPTADQRNALVKGASEGDAESQYRLAILYEPEQDGPNDEAAALQLYKQAADQGHKKAQFTLGLIYAMGHGVVEDHVTAATWYSLAAEQGHEDAQFMLGNLYRRGEPGVPRDHTQAAKWLKAAAKGGAMMKRVSQKILDEIVKDGLIEPEL